MRLTVNGYTYIWHTAGSKLEIISGKTIPETLYKYYSLTENSVDALTKLYVYASHPLQLNDPFDCDESLICIDDLKDAEALLGPLFIEYRKSFPDDRDLFAFCTQAFSVLMYKKYGIISLTDDHQNDVMWSNYANNDGFCVEFDYKEFPFKFSGPFPINYVENLMGVTTSKYDVQPAMLYQTNVKKIDWKYEKEFRILVHNPPGLDMLSFGKEASKYNHIDDYDRKFRYPLKAIRSITIGSLFFNNEDTFCVSGQEIDYYTQDKLKIRLLDFLHSVSSSPYDETQIYLSHKNVFERERLRIRILKLSENQYRIIQQVNLNE